MSEVEPKLELSFVVNERGNRVKKHVAVVLLGLLTSCSGAKQPAPGASQSPVAQVNIPAEEKSPEPKVQEHEALLKALGSSEPAISVEMMEELSGLAYKSTDPKLRNLLTDLILTRLETPDGPDSRTGLAAILKNFLANELTPVESFVRAEPLLTDPQSFVSECLWTAFSEPVSQDILTEEIDDRLLSLMEDPNNEIKFAASEWAIKATKNRQLLMGPNSPQPELLEKSMRSLQPLTKAEAPYVRKLAISGILAQSELYPAKTNEVITKHLADPSGEVRATLLDFLILKVRFSEHLPLLEPTVLARFQQPNLGKGFPELPYGAPSGTEKPERFRLAEILTLLGTESEDVRTYLQVKAVKEVHPSHVLQLAAAQGSEGRPLLTKFLQQNTYEDWSKWSKYIAAIGLPEASLQVALDKLSRPLDKDADYNKVRTNEELLVSLALASSTSPEIKALLIKKLASPHPGLQAAAAYVLAVKDPKGPGGKAALETISQGDWSSLDTDQEYLLLAAYRLREHGLKATPSLRLSSSDLQTLLNWVLGESSPESLEPSFLRPYTSKEAAAQGEPGTGDDLLKLQLEWLTENPRPVTKAGIEVLLKHPKAEVKAAAKKALEALKEK